MGINKSLSDVDGVFENQTDLENSQPALGSTVAINNGTSISFYRVATTGTGINLANGNVAIQVNTSAGAVTTDDVDNDSTVTGATATAALNELQEQINQMTSTIDALGFTPVSGTAKQEIATGATGDILTIPAVSGQKIRLNSLIPDSTTIVPNIEIEIGGNVYMTGKTLSGYATNVVNSFYIGNTNDDSNESQGGGAIPPLLSGVNQSIIVRLTSGSTSTVINYNYEYGT